MVGVKAPRDDLPAPGDVAIRPRAVLAVRAAHALISLWFLGCLAYIYYAAIARKRTRALAVASGAIVAEGIIVGVNNGDCPLGAVHRRYGDEKTFFELFLPGQAAKAAVPVLGLVAIAGLALVVIRPPTPDSGERG